MIKDYLVTAHVNCIVSYEYLVAAEDEYNALFIFTKLGADQFKSLDHEVIQDNEIVRIENIKEAYS